MRARRRAIRLSKPLEDVWQKVSSDAWSSVAHRDLHVMFILADTNTDCPAAGSKLRSIRQQVPDNLLEAIDVARNYFQAFLKVCMYTNVLCFQRWPDCIERGIHDRDQIDWSKVKLKFSRDDARDVKDVFDDLFLRPCISLDYFDRVRRAFIIETSRF